MKITLYGAAGEVTGSAYHVETGQASLLLDFGMFQGQGADERNVVPHGLRVEDIDAVVLTHAHLDHSGRLPLLSRGGWSGPIHATPATIELTGLILRDAAHLQEMDSRHGEAPLFGPADVEATMRLLRPLDYDKPLDVVPGIQARLLDAGHILGSASVELSVEDNGRRKRIAFSGDLGPRGVPILRDYVPPGDAELVFLESTYGDRDHHSPQETAAEFEEIVRNVVRHKGKILIPTFAVGRAQLLLFHLAAMFRSGRVPRFPVYLDSPMAIEATKIYDRHPELYDLESRKLHEHESVPPDLATLRVTATSAESRALNGISGPCLIMAGSGMCTGGRILHHLQHNLWRDDTWVVIVGYQSVGSLGRDLVDGHRVVSIFGDPVEVKAQVHTLGGFSAHAGQSDLLEWFSHLARSRPRVVLTHGEARGRDALARLLRERHGVAPELPEFADAVEL